MDFVEAAGFPVVAFTAYYAAFELVNLKPKLGEKPKVLVHSAAGGVGSMLVQLLKIAGCEVCGVVGSMRKVHPLMELAVCDMVIDKSM